MSEPGLSIPSSTFDYHQALPAPEGPPPRPRYWVHGLLLAATCFTTLVVGARLDFNFQQNLPPFTAGNELLPFFPVGWALAQPSRLLLGIPFSAALLIILLSHEMGHYLLCRYYGVRATLPFFIPAPTLIGTLGAVIRIKAPIRSRTALFDIGVAGPDRRVCDGHSLVGCRHPAFEASRPRHGTLRPATGISSHLPRCPECVAVLCP